MISSWLFICSLLPTSQWQRKNVSQSFRLALTEMCYKMKQGTLRLQSPVYAKLLRKKMQLVTKWLEEQVHVRFSILLKVKHFLVFEKILRQFCDIFRSLHGTWGLSPRIIWEEYWCLLLCTNSTWGTIKWLFFLFFLNLGFRPNFFEIHK